MPIITRINTTHSPLLVGAQGYDAERREWVAATDATIFADEDEAARCIELHGLLDVRIYSDPLLE